MTTDWAKFREYKENGLVKDVFAKQATLDKLKGSTGIGHVRYPTAGSSSAQEAQPFFVNSPLGMYLIHNGNLTNTDALRETLNSSDSFFNRHMKTDSDSEVLLNVFADEVHRAHQKYVAAHAKAGGGDPNAHKLQFVLEAGEGAMKVLEGAYSCIALVKGVGLVAFRDPHGIRLVVVFLRGLCGRVFEAVCVVCILCVVSRLVCCCTCLTLPQTNTNTTPTHRQTKKARSCWASAPAPTATSGRSRRRTARSGRSRLSACATCSRARWSSSPPRASWSVISAPSQALCA